MLTDQQTKLASALVELSNLLPSVSRTAAGELFTDVLDSVGLRFEDFTFLIGPRPRAHAPSSLVKLKVRTTASQERRYVFALFDHSGQEAGHGYEVYGERVGQGYASLDELAAQLKVTTQAVRVHLSNANKKNGWASRPHNWWRDGGFLDFTLNDSRFEQATDMPPIDSPSLAEQVAKRKARPRTFRGRY